MCLVRTGAAPVRTYFSRQESRQAAWNGEDEKCRIPFGLRLSRPMTPEAIAWRALLDGE